jgi:hypothetical protein
LPPFETGRDLYFWFDCETTGLNPHRDTVLEVAWCFTDERLRQLTPLTQRYTKLTAKATGREGRRPVFQPRLLDPSDEANWHDNDYISPVARQMHEDSGLREAWMRAAQDNPRRVLTHSRDLFRLVAEDLDSLAATSDDRLVLAGAGVSHFDDSVLAEVFERFYPRRPVIDGSGSPLGRWHYRCFDTSIGLWVGDARQLTERVLEVAYGADKDASGTVPYSVIESEEGAEAEVSHLVRSDGGDTSEFVRSAAIGHRAADDVVWSLLDARALRFAVSLVSL